MVQWVVGTRFLHYLDHSGVQQGGGDTGQSKKTSPGKDKAQYSKIVTQPIQFNYTTASNTHHGQLGANTTLILP